MGVGKFVCNPLDSVFAFNDFLHFVRNSFDLVNVIFIFCLIDGTLNTAKLNSNGINGNQLGTVGLCCGYRDFRTCQCIEHIVGFSCNGGTHHVNDCQSIGTQLVGKDYRLLGILGFS